MKWTEFKIAAMVLFLPLLLLAGCQGNKLVSPVRLTNLSVTVPLPKSLKASLLGASSNEIFYNLTAKESGPVTGSTGTFSTSGQTGSFTFVISGVSTDGNPILSLQLNNALTHQPLAIGAAQLVSDANTLTVELGSVVRTCYSVQPGQTYTCSESGGGFFGFNAYYEDYGTSSLTNTYDMHWTGLVDATPTCLGTYDLEDGWTGSAKSLAYLGNGRLVDYDTVPTNSNFYSDGGAAKLAASAATTTIEAGDIFCVKLQGGTTPGHAWVQFTGAGDTTDAPTFIFRVRNDSTPYYLYDQSLEDISNAAVSISDCTLDQQGW